MYGGVPDLGWTSPVTSTLKLETSLGCLCLAKSDSHDQVHQFSPSDTITTRSHIHPSIGSKPRRGATEEQCSICPMHWLRRTINFQACEKLLDMFNRNPKTEVAV